MDHRDEITAIGREYRWAHNALNQKNWRLSDYQLGDDLLKTPDRYTLLTEKSDAEFVFFSVNIEPHSRKNLKRHHAEFCVTRALAEKYRMGKPK